MPMEVDDEWKITPAQRELHDIDVPLSVPRWFTWIESHHGGGKPFSHIQRQIARYMNALEAEHQCPVVVKTMTMERTERFQAVWVVFEEKV